MIRKRTILSGMDALALAGVAWAVGTYRASMAAIGMPLSRCISVIDAIIVALDYAAAGKGAPLMMVRSTGIQ